MDIEHNLLDGFSPDQSFIICVMYQSTKYFLYVSEAIFKNETSC